MVVRSINNEDAARNPRPTTSVEWVTPRLAREWLDNKRPNRNLKEKKIEEFRRAFLDEEWFITCQGLGFDIEGRLVDGQNRLEALIRSGIAGAWFVVVRGLDPRAMEVIDDGNKRSTTDELRRLEESEYAARAGGIGIYARYAAGVKKGYTFGTARTLTFSRRELVRMLREVEEAVYPYDVVPASRRLAARFKAPTSAVVAFYWRACLKGYAVEAGEFLERVTTGEMIVRDDPEYALRERLDSIRDKQPKDYAFTYLMYIVRAFNLTIRGRKITQINYNPTNGKPVPDVGDRP